MSYLVLPNAGNFTAFMKLVFGAVEQLLVPRENGGIMHGELRIGDSVIMFADTTEQFGAKPASLFIYVENVDDVYQKALDAGAVSIMVPSKKEYGYTCGFSDAFGNDWWPTAFIEQPH